MRFIVGGPRIFGLRTGILFGRRDIEKLLNGRALARSGIVSGQAIYVIKGAHRRCKVGVTGNTEQRINDLRTGSAFPIEYAYIGIPDDPNGAPLIEDEVLQTLEPYKTHRDWFSVSPEAAVGTICAVAYRLGIKLLEVSPEQAERIRVATALAQQTALSRPSLPIITLRIIGLIVLFLIGALLYFIATAP